MEELIQIVQKDSNREFTPVIARNLSAAYEWCASESGRPPHSQYLLFTNILLGGGQYSRMKKHMTDHIESSREEMFTESANEVKK